MTSMDSRPVLILGGAPRITVPLARCLHNHCGVPVEVAYLSPKDPRIYSRAIRDSFSLPDFRQNPARFIESLTSAIRERGFDTLFPVQDGALAAIAQNYDVLTSLLRVACPPPQVLDRVLNKERTLEIAQQCGIPVPLSFRASSVAELDAISGLLTFPMVMKPSARRGETSFKARYLHTLPELRTALAENRFGEMLLQNYCPGAGVGIEMLLHDGQPLAVFQHRRLKEEPATGGVAVMAIAEQPDPDLVKASLALLCALEWEGVAMVEFRKDAATGAFALLEVNGRYWGTSSLPILAGMEFPAYHWRLLHGENPQVPESYAVGMRWRWTAGYVSRLHGLLLRSAERVGPRPSLAREILSAPLDFVPSVRDALWSFRDPPPALRELGQTMREWAIADLKWLMRKLVPELILQERQTYQRLGKAAGRIHLKLRILDVLHICIENRRSVSSDAGSFVFVCHGNIMRSAMAAEMFKRALAERGLEGQIAVCSAGMHAVPGREAHSWALTVSREIGMPLTHHRAQPLTPEMVNQADAIFAMDFENKAELMALYPEAKRKICMLSAYAEGSQRYREIPDPFHQDLEGTRRCYTSLQICIDNLMSALFQRASLPERAQRSAVPS